MASFQETTAFRDSFAVEERLRAAIARAQAADYELDLAQDNLSNLLSLQQQESPRRACKTGLPQRNSSSSSKQRSSSS